LINFLRLTTSIVDGAKVHMRFMESSQ